jgi:uncharacterized protein YegP (UPF0339 family)
MSEQTQETTETLATMQETQTPQMSPGESKNETATGQTGQRRNPYFEIARDQEGKYHWTLWSANGRAMATNALDTGYNTLSDCKAAISTFAAALTPDTRILIAS